MTPITPKIARHNGWRVVWHRGEYAEIYPYQGRTPVDVFNLWDHDAGRPQKDYSTAELRAKLRAWLTDNKDILDDHLMAAGY